MIPGVSPDVEDEWGKGIGGGWAEGKRSMVCRDFSKRTCDGAVGDVAAGK